MLVLGVLLPGGIGAISYGIIMDTVSPKILPQYHAVVSGMINASSGIGNTLLTPVISTAIVAGGLASGMAVLAVPTLLMIPITLWLCPRNKTKQQRAEKAVVQDTISTGKLIRLAVKSKAYLFIVIGFFYLWVSYGAHYQSFGNADYFLRLHVSRIFLCVFCIRPGNYGGRADNRLLLHEI